MRGLPGEPPLFIVQCRLKGLTLKHQSTSMPDDKQYENARRGQIDDDQETLYGPDPAPRTSENVLARSVS